MFDAGDVVSRFKLDISQFSNNYKKVQSQVAALGSNVKGMTNDIVANDKASKGWWKTYGRVAIGFTVAYRAMNLFEAGVGKLTGLIRDAIVETGELSAYQAKLTMYYKLASKSQDSFAEIFQKATGNVNALAEASITAVSSLDTLTTGFDELAQAGVIVSRELTPAFTSLISFTELVAQTTGSNIRQIRQEFQALAEGRIRTTDILARSMKRFEIITDKDLSNLKSQVNTQEIIEKIAIRIHEQWEDVKDLLLESDVTLALGFWEKSFRGIAREAIKISSNVAGVQNIFAAIFKNRGETLADSFSARDTANYVVLVNDLAYALDRLLIVATKAFKSFLDGYNNVRNFVKSLVNAYEKVGWFRESVNLLYESFKLLLEVKLVQMAFTTLGKTFLWIAKRPIIMLASGFSALNKEITLFNGLIKTTYLRLLLIPSLFAAGALSIYSFYQTILQRVGEFKDSFKNLWGDIKTSVVDTVKDMVTSITQIIEDYTPDWVKKLGDTLTWFKKLNEESEKSIQNSVNNLAKASESGLIEKKLQEGVDKLEKGVKKVSEIFKDLGENALIVADKTGETLTSAGKSYTKFYGDWWGNFKDNFESVTDLISKNVSRLTDSFGSDQKEEVEKFISLVEQFRKAEKELIEDGNELPQIFKDRSFLAGINEGIEDFMANVKTEFDYGQDLAKETATSMQESFSDLFFDFSKGELKSWKDYVETILNSVMRSLANTLSSIITSQIFDKNNYGSGSFLGGIINSLSGGGGSSGITMTDSDYDALGSLFEYHTGGIVGSGQNPSRLLSSSIFANAKYAHKGLMAGEVPIIAKKGEGIFTPDQMKALGPAGGAEGTNVVIMAMDSKSFKDVIDRNAQTVISPLKKYLRYGDRELRDLRRRSR